MYIRDEKVSGLSADIEAAYSPSENGMLYINLNNVLPSIGIGYRYFIPLPNNPSYSNKLFNFTNIRWGKYEELSYTSIITGFGTQWDRWSTIEFSLGYHILSRNSAYPNAYSVSVMVRALLW